MDERCTRIRIELTYHSLRIEDTSSINRDPIFRSQLTIGEILCGNGSYDFGITSFGNWCALQKVIEIRASSDVYKHSM